MNQRFHRAQLISRTCMKRLCVFLLAMTLAACTGDSATPQPGDEEITLNNRGVALMGQFDYAGASQVFEELVERLPEWHDARTNLAIAYMNRQEPGDDQLVLRELVTVLAAVPDDARANYIAGLLRLYLGDVEMAAGRFEAVLALDPTDAYAHYYLGQCLMQTGEAESALTAYQRAIELDPYLRSAYYGAALIQQRLGLVEAAGEQLTAYERFANNPRARLAEFKYTRMGPKSLALAVSLDPEIAESPARPGGPLFENARASGRLGGVATSAYLSTVDVDQDGSQELLLTDDAGARLLLANADSNFVSYGEQPWSDITKINAVAWGDVDDDGLVDVYLCRNGPNQLWLQSTTGEWQMAGGAANVDDADRECADVAMLDADHDGDLDLLIANHAGGDNLLSNNRDGTFRSLADELGAAADARDTHRVITTDLDADRDADLIFLHDSPPHLVLINNRLWNYTESSGLDDFLNMDMRAVAAADLNADGRTELLGVNREGQVIAWLAGDNDSWQAVTVYESQLPDDLPIDLAILDLTGDGREELILLGPGHYEVIAVSSELQGNSLALERFAGGMPIPVLRSATEGSSLLAVGEPAEQGELLEWAPGPGRHSFTTVTFSGKHDEAETMRSNASGIGTQVNLRNGSHWTVSDTYKHASLRGHSLQPLSIGLRGRAQADFIAVYWSDGVFQTELDLDSGPLHRIAEIERQLSSCPVLFAWDGSRFAFVTDLLGVGGLGGFVEPGIVGTPRPWERLKLEPGRIASHNGRLKFKLTEPMQENAYVDAIRLDSYDLPPEWQIVIDERMATGAPEVTGDALFYRTSLSPISARDAAGTDVLSLISERDQRAMSPGDIDRRFIGLLKNTESLMLEFDHPIDRLPGQPDAIPILVADAWVEYPYSQTAFAAWQAGLQYRSATLDARDGNGQWHRVYTEFGYPAGMPREMSLPLQELPPGTDALRLHWNRELYWDRIRIVYAETPPEEMRQASYAPESARVAKSGFPRRTTFAQKRPLYDYAERVPFWDTEYMSGFYTRLGGVTELLARTDDAIAIIGPGEEIHVEFAADDGPPNGMRRWYVLETHGWAKDKDMYTRDGETVGPLPRSDTGADDNLREDLHRRFNTRFQAGQ